MENKYFFGGLVLLGVLLVMKTDSTVRGVRNNNPLNIRFNSKNDWFGQVGKDADGFVIFDTPENGFRAAAILLKNYSKMGFKTIREIISRWAPKEENPTNQYVDFVAGKLALHPDSEIDVSHYFDLLNNMSRFELGDYYYSAKQINDGINGAFT